VEARVEAELEDGSRRRPRNNELGRDVFGDGEVALAAVLERRQLELDLVAVLLTGPELDRTQVERLHVEQGSAGEVPQR